MDLYNLVISAKLSKGEGGDVSVDPLSVTENGTYTASSGHAYSPVTVNVPNSYDASDEGKVVSNGALVGQTSATKTANGTYDTTLNNEVVVNVPGPSGSISITQNGTVDVSQYASANVNVSGGSGSADLAALIDKSITSIVIPSGVTSIGAYVFRGCSNLESVTIPNGVTSISNDAFYGCGALESIALPSGVTSIGGNAFRNCYNMSFVELPSTVVSIDSSAFASCMTSGGTFICRATTPPTIGSSVLTSE